MASVILGEELHPLVGFAAGAMTAVAGGIHFACTRTVHCPVRRLLRHSAAPAAA
jgi:uncharacterized protein